MKRLSSALLWFGVAWVAYEVVWSVSGVPRLGGPLLAFAISAFVVVDPFTLFRADTETPIIHGGEGVRSPA